MTTQGSIPNHQGIGERKLIPAQSASRPELTHYFDPERELCTCEGFQRWGWCGHLNCRHCKGYGTIIRYPRLLPCPVCGGDGRAS